MNDSQLGMLKYPIGKFQKPQQISKLQLIQWIGIISQFPEQIEAQVQPLTKEELSWRYRPEGWTIKQVVHHCADSHINSFIRFKWALTEDNPIIKAYDEVLWADLSDGNDDDLSGSMLLLKGLHYKWVKLLNSLSEIELERIFIHPTNKKSYNLKTNIGIYAWHCQHHLEHIRQAIRTKDSFL